MKNEAWGQPALHFKFRLPVRGQLHAHGLSESCTLFQIFGTFLQWVVSYKSGSEVIPNYLALLLFSCLPNNPPYRDLLMTLREVAKDLGVPLKRGPERSHRILGHQVRLPSVELHFPEDQLS